MKTWVKWLIGIIIGFVVLLSFRFGNFSGQFYIAFTSFGRYVFYLTVAVISLMSLIAIIRIPGKLDKLAEKLDALKEDKNNEN